MTDRCATALLERVPQKWIRFCDQNALKLLKPKRGVEYMGVRPIDW
jgi:hypothetical protein